MKKILRKFFNPYATAGYFTLASTPALAAPGGTTLLVGLGLAIAAVVAITLAVQDDDSGS